MKSIKTLLLIISVAIGQTAFAIVADQSQTNRYSLESLAPAVEQRRLLSVVIQQRFAENIKSVGDAIEALLEPNGYHLEDPETTDSHQYLLFNQPLPAIHRQLGPLRLQAALSLLAGDVFELVVNPVTRTIGYRLNPSYAEAFTAVELAQARQAWRDHREHRLLLDHTKPYACDRSFYGPVRPGETLLTIANKLAMEGVAIEQVLIALQEYNPQVFPHRNINGLVAGVLLYIPEQKEIATFSLDLSRQKVKQQYRQWKSRKKIPGNTNKKATDSGLGA